MGVGQSRVVADGLPILLKSRVDISTLSTVFQSPTKAEPGLCGTRVDPQRLPELRNGLIILPKLREGRTEALVGRPVVRRAIQGVGPERPAVAPIGRLQECNDDQIEQDEAGDGGARQPPLRR